MEPIREGATGPAVEDVQSRLAQLDYVVDTAERDASTFGPTTATAIARFRVEHDLPLGAEVDSATWSVLVDEGYHMGDRTLYLRLPNFHGADVKVLQNALTVLGFSCGECDGYYGPFTETAVKQFQENVGLFADGMAFQDTFAAIDRLHHVWAGTPAKGPHPTGGMGFSRAAGVLEETGISLGAEDAISRNVAGRIWNLASATTEASRLRLVESPDDALPTDDVLLILGCSPKEATSNVANVVVTETDTLPLRLRTACESSSSQPPHVRMELPLSNDYDGTFTSGDAQTLAVMLLDALCLAFEK